MKKHLQIIVMIAVLAVIAGLWLIARPASASTLVLPAQGEGIAEPAATEEITPTSVPNAAPQKNYFTTAIVVLTWNSVSWADGYELQISKNSNFTNLINLNNPLPISPLSFTTPALANGTYYWRVRALRADGAQGSWSGIEQLTISVNLVPPPPTGTFTPMQDIAATSTPTSTPSLTFTATTTFTPTPSPQPSVTASSTFTPTYTATFTKTPSATPTRTPDPQPSMTASPTFTATMTQTPSWTPAPTSTGTITITPTHTPSATFTPSKTPNATLTRTPTVFPPPTLPGGGCVDNCPP